MKVSVRGLWVDGRAMAPELVARRAMNFSQNWRGVPVVEVPYELVLPHAAAVGLIDGLVDEYREDSEQHPDPDCVLETLWRASGWVGGAEALKRPALLAELVDFLAMDLLDCSLKSSGPVAYLINTVDEGWSTSDGVHLRGVAGVVASM
jgi:hypothetical protein